jgi:hypothetical protein
LAQIGVPAVTSVSCGEQAAGAIAGSGHLIRVKGVDEEERMEESSLCRNAIRLRWIALN